ncbi:MAG: hypothetical protein BGO69_00400 [Bacteroidetes bacterium 46-16]|nr:MAG: hypothetical protein BGO69_00400 [Bacteroidetes bacterium 46-16]
MADGFGLSIIGGLDADIFLAARKSVSAAAGVGIFPAGGKAKGQQGANDDTGIFFHKRGFECKASRGGPVAVI